MKQSNRNLVSNLLHVYIIRISYTLLLENVVFEENKFQNNLKSYCYMYKNIKLGTVNQANNILLWL
jgi:hypothetical protein